MDVPVILADATGKDIGPIGGGLIGAGLVAVIAAGGKVILDILGYKRVARADVVSEWKDLNKAQGERITILEGSITDHTNKLVALYAEHATCKSENAQLKSEVGQLRGTIQRLQGITHDELPSVPATVIADTDGLIYSVSPAIAGIFNVLPNDLIRKNIEVLIPERFRESHRKGLQNIKISGRLPTPDNIILTWGIRKAKPGETDPREIPIAISLTGFQSGPDNRIMIYAEIRQRPVKFTVPEGSGEHEVLRPN